MVQFVISKRQYDKLHECHGELVDIACRWIELLKGEIEALALYRETWRRGKYKDAAELGVARWRFFEKRFELEPLLYRKHTTLQTMMALFAIEAERVIEDHP